MCFVLRYSTVVMKLLNESCDLSIIKTWQTFASVMFYCYTLRYLYFCFTTRLNDASVVLYELTWPVCREILYVVIMISEPSLITQVAEFGIGATAVLKCNSNDDNHNFMFWQLGQNKIIGPGNHYDQSKYKYEVLSGKLLIKDVSQQEAGYYRCISKNLNSDSLNIGAVQMVVKPHSAALLSHDNSEIEIIKIIFIIISLLMLIICAVLFYRMRKQEKKMNARLAAFADEDEDEGSGDEIYNRTTTVINDAMPGPSNSNKNHITGIDNQGLDTNFNAAFEQIAINVANRNLV